MNIPAISHYGNIVFSIDRKPLKSVLLIRELKVKKHPGAPVSDQEVEQSKPIFALIFNDERSVRSYISALNCVERTLKDGVFSNLKHYNNFLTEC